MQQFNILARAFVKRQHTTTTEKVKMLKIYEKVYSVPSWYRPCKEDRRKMRPEVNTKWKKSTD